VKYYQNRPVARGSVKCVKGRTFNAFFQPDTVASDGSAGEWVVRWVREGSLARRQAQGERDAVREVHLDGHERRLDPDLGATVDDGRVIELRGAETFGIGTSPSKAATAKVGQDLLIVFAPLARVRAKKAATTPVDGQYAAA
jgi:hypothetical protein